MLYVIILIHGWGSSLIVTHCQYSGQNVLQCLVSLDIAGMTGREYTTGQGQEVHTELGHVNLSVVYARNGNRIAHQLPSRCHIPGTRNRNQLSSCMRARARHLMRMLCVMFVRHLSGLPRCLVSTACSLLTMEEMRSC